MATVTKTEKRVVVEETYTLVLTKQEAEVLYSLVGCVGGYKVNARKVTNKIYEAFKNSDLENDTCDFEAKVTRDLK